MINYDESKWAKLFLKNIKTKKIDSRVDDEIILESIKDLMNFQCRPSCYSHLISKSISNNFKVAILRWGMSSLGGYLRTQLARLKSFPSNVIKALMNHLS